MFDAHGYWLARLVFKRGLALVYLIAFIVALNQFRPLAGERGLLPVPQFVKQVAFREAPSLFHFWPKDAAFQAGWMQDHARRIRLRHMMHSVIVGSSSCNARVSVSATKMPP